MAAGMDDVNRYLTGGFERAMQGSLSDMSALARLVAGGPPRRASHTRPPTENEQADFEEWKKTFNEVMDVGYRNDWLSYEYDEDPRPLDSAPPVVVYDETEKEHKQRLAEWWAAQPPRPRHVTFPVVNSRPEGLDE
jgi:hypothetical protein